MRNRHYIWNLFVLIVGVGAAFYLYQTYVPQPQNITDEAYYQMGTHGKFGGDVLQPIEVAVAGDYTEITPFGIASKGFYDPNDNTITIDKVASHTTLYTEDVLPHEYGHALMHAYLSKCCGVEAKSMAEQTLDALSVENVPTVLKNPTQYGIPESLIPLIEEYQDNSEAFGKYGSQCFGEWFAEASRVFVNDDGEGIPPTTKAFLSALSDMSAKTNDGKPCQTCHTEW